MKKGTIFHVEYCPFPDCGYKITGNWYQMIKAQMKEHELTHKPNVREHTERNLCNRKK